VHGVQWIGLGELPNDLFGMQWQWLQQRLGNAASTLGARADRPDAMYAVSREWVCGGRASLLGVQRNRATLERWAAGPAPARERAPSSAPSSIVPWVLYTLLSASERPLPVCAR
jgi:hypothetical protein